MRSDPDFLRSGSALLLVLWSLILLSMSVFGVVEIVEASVSHASHLELAAQARALAMSGLAVALAPDMKADDSLLHQQPAPDQKWSVSLEGEGGRLNLNQLLLNGHRDVLERLFVQWGLEQSDAQHAADCLYNWVAPLPVAGVAGQTDTATTAATLPTDGLKADYEKAGLTHFPTNLPFTALSEANYVLGMDLVEKAKPDWQDSFTLWSDGPLDVNEAPADSLAAVLGLPLSMMQSFVETRNGKDGMVGTADDITVPDMATLKRMLGLGGKAAAALEPEIAFTDSVRRVKSTGETHGVAVVVSVVTRLNTTPPEYLSWNEL